jgi:hypothetical protein
MPVPCPLRYIEVKYSSFLPNIFPNEAFNKLKGEFPSPPSIYGLTFGARW